MVEIIIRQTRDVNLARSDCVCKIVSSQKNSVESRVNKPLYMFCLSRLKFKKIAFICIVYLKQIFTFVLHDRCVYHESALAHFLGAVTATVRPTSAK